MLDCINKLIKFISSRNEDQNLLEQYYCGDEKVKPTSEISNLMALLESKELSRTIEENSFLLKCKSFDGSEHLRKYIVYKHYTDNGKEAVEVIHQSLSK